MLLNTYLPLLALFATFAFLVLTWAAEREVFRQMVAGRYHSVSLVRTGRLLRIPALLTSIGFVMASLYSAAPVAITVLAIASLVTLASHGPHIMYDGGARACLHTMLPWTLCLGAVTSLAVNGLAASAIYPFQPAACVLLAGAASWVARMTAKWRLEQDLFSLRD
jgi:hypothetical protein